MKHIWRKRGDELGSAHILCAVLRILRSTCSINQEERAGENLRHSAQNARSTQKISRAI
jgi:hypothetical protein